MESLLLPLAFIGLAVFLFVSGRSARKRQAAMQEELQNNLEPGAWVMTSSGFYGRFVERDGDIVILETVDGTETFWANMAIRQVVGELPLAGVTEAGETVDETPGKPVEIVVKDEEPKVEDPDAIVEVDKPTTKPADRD